MYKLIFFNTGAQIIGKIFTASITLLVTLLIGRSLGPAGFGDFTKIFVFVGYFLTLADFGLNTVFVKSKKDETRMFDGLLALRLVWASVLVALAIFVAYMMPYDPTKQTGFSPLVKVGIVAASVTILTQAIYTTANAYFQKNLSYHLSTIAAVCSYLVILFVIIAVTFTNPSLLGYVSSYVAGGIVLVALSLWLILKKRASPPVPSIDIGVWRNYTKKAWPVGIALILNLIYFRVDVLILSNVRSAAEVGLYGLAYQFFETSLAVPIFFANAIFPALSKLYESDRKQFESQVKTWAKILFASSVVLALALIVTSKIIPIIYDDRFAGSVPALQILSLGMPFFFLSALLWHLLIIYGKQKFLALIYASGAVFNLSANLILIPIYGYMAAAAITVVSEALILLLLTLSVRRVS